MDHSHGYLHVRPLAQNADSAIRGLVDLAKALHVYRTNTIGDLPNEDIRTVRLHVDDLMGTKHHEFTLGDQLGVMAIINDVEVYATHESDPEALIDAFGIKRVILITSRLDFTPFVGPTA